MDAARATGDPWLISAALDAIRTAAAGAGRFREAMRTDEARMALLASMDRTRPRSAMEVGDTFGMAWADAIGAGDLATALTVVDAARHDDLAGIHSYQTRSHLIVSRVFTGAWNEAIHEAERLAGTRNRPLRLSAAWMAPALSAVELLCRLRDDDTSALRWRARAAEIMQAEVDENPHAAAFSAFAAARLAVHRCAIPAADAAAIVDRTFQKVPRFCWFEPYARATGAELAVVAGLPDAADRLEAARSAAEQNSWAAACLGRAAGRLHGDHDALEEAAQGFERIGARFEHAVTLILLPDRADEGSAALAALGVPASLLGQSAD